MSALNAISTAVERVVGPLASPLARPQLWTTLGWLDIVQVYRRTNLGPLWITANLAIFVLAMTYVYGALFGIPTKEYSAYLLCGMIAWSWIASLLAEVGNGFVNYSYFIKGMALDKAQLIWATVFKLLLTFLHHLVVVVAYIVLGVIEFSWWSLQIVPAILVLFAFSVPVTAIACILFARYRDLQRFIGSATIVVMMLTPIFWQPSMLKDWRGAIVWLNPFHYLIELIRTPLLGRPLDGTTISVVLCITVAAWIGGGMFFRRYHRYVVFWV